MVYCALDREFSQPILKEFEERTGIEVLSSYDTESTKSVGLAERIIREKSRPRCDVFWNNEILNTIRLVKAGVLEPNPSAVGRTYPATYRSPDDLWFGFAARARVLLINTDRLDPKDAPVRLEDLTDPKWRGKVGMAKPLFGTTATQMACLFAVWGPEKTKNWLRRLKENDVRILSGNKQVAIDVGAGQLAMGLTDTDDSLEEIRSRRPVRMVFIESGPEDLGVLFIPNSIAVVKGTTRQVAARRLVDYLLSPEVEKELALGPSGQIPLNPKTAAKPGLGIPDDAKSMEVDFAAAAKAWDDAMRYIKDEFTASN